MLSITLFVFIFVAATLLSVAVIRFLNRNADPLRKAWNVYGAMYVLHFLLFLGIVLTLPVTSGSYRSGTATDATIQTMSDVDTELRRQREDIETLKDQLHSTTESVHNLAFLILLFGPILYYNLFKYNLEIERLSGKRMGSFE